MVEIISMIPRVSSMLSDKIYPVTSWNKSGDSNKTGSIPLMLKRKSGSKEHRYRWISTGKIIMHSTAEIPATIEKTMPKTMTAAEASNGLLLYISPHAAIKTATKLEMKTGMFKCTEYDKVRAMADAVTARPTVCAYPPSAKLNRFGLFIRSSIQGFQFPNRDSMRCVNLLGTGNLIHQRSG
jgi:hypothetical protein